jgi:hypothetical protein
VDPLQMTPALSPRRDLYDAPRAWAQSEVVGGRAMREGRARTTRQHCLHVAALAGLDDVPDRIHATGGPMQPPARNPRGNRPSPHAEAIKLPHGDPPVLASRELRERHVHRGFC